YPSTAQSAWPVAPIAATIAKYTFSLNVARKYSCKPAGSGCACSGFRAQRDKELVKKSRLIKKI
ncbi:MAG: hypothetical protein KDA48_13150, partial [Amphiplicatus sp.]|nr:hypothetical protein [Amphiplicatus sp.]